MITPGSYFGNKYCVGHQIGSGGFSKVYQGVNINSGELVAIKTEKEGGRQLKHEARVYKRLIGGVGIPFVHWFGTEHGYNALVIDLLGCNLEQLFNYCNRQFSLKTVLLLGDQLISRIEYIHSKSLIHGDIKPENFAIGFGMLEDQINVLDFGLTGDYRDPQTRAHRSYRENQHPKGTPRYMSINAHLGITQSRRDDMLSLGYMLLYFLCGSLPWQGLKAATSKQKDDMIKMKKATCIEELCHGSPLTAYFMHIRSLKFDGKPDYCYLRDIFRDFYKQQPFQNDYLFDWIVYRERRNPVAGVQEEQLCGQSGRLEITKAHPQSYIEDELTEESLVSQLRVIHLLLSCNENELFIEFEFFKLRNKDLRDTSIDWPHLVGQMRAFLHKCCDFYLASNHPIASDKIKRSGKDHSVPWRMWKILQSLLEVMLKGLPNSLEHMLSVIRMAYRCLTVILNYDRQHKEVWMECLGDVSRYRMAIEEVDMKVRALHGEVASYWYKKTVNLNPEEGRLQHHLGVLSRPDVLQQLFYYSKALISVKPFIKLRETMDTGLFSLLPKMATEYPAYPQALTIFVEAHRLLFTRQDYCLFIQKANEFISQLDGHVSSVGPMFRAQGVYIVASNYAAIFNYGHEESEMMAFFNMAKLSQTRNLDILNEAYQYWQNPSCRQLSVDQVAQDTKSGDTVVSLASKLAFATLGIILDRKEDSTMLPSVHVSLAFLWCLAVVPQAMNRIQTYVPWKRIADYLNMCITPDTDMSEIENAEFPGNELGPVRQFPEDFFIRGFSWSQLYFPQGFFRESEEDSESDIEFPPVTKSRKRRCLWMGIRLADFKCWLEYDSEERKFCTTPFADDLAALRGDTKPIKMNLVGLPTELLQLLAEFLEKESDISALTRTNRHLHSVFISCLYRNEKNNSTALLWAASEGNVDTARTSIQYGANPNARDDYGWTPLSRAASEGHDAIVDLLLNTAGVNPDLKEDYGWTPLSRAASKGHEAVVKLLLNTAGVDSDSKDDDGRTPLSWAASEGHEAVVKLLLNTAGVDPDSKDDDSWTPLSQAASEGHEAIVKLLLDTDRVNLDSKDDYGWTPLTMAASEGHEAVVKLLLNTAGVDPDSKGNDGSTPLSRAALKGHKAIVKLLLDTDRVNPDSKDDYGWTPLFWAASEGYESIVKLLLNTAGVDPNSKGNNGLTPLSLAESKGHKAIVNLLLNLDSKDYTG